MKQDKRYLKIASNVEQEDGNTREYIYDAYERKIIGTL